MILTQPEIKKAVSGKQIEFTPTLEDDQWGEASIDLRLGFHFTTFKPVSGIRVSVAAGLSAIGNLQCWDSSELPEFNNHGQRQSYTLEPGKFVLAMTYESIKVPRSMIARVEGRSHYARMGLSMHQTAPWIQPGWSGPIVLEIMNNGSFTIDLTPKIDRPCQITFFKFSKPLPENMTYGTRTGDAYQNQTHPLVHKKTSTVISKKARKK